MYDTRLQVSSLAFSPTFKLIAEKTLTVDTKCFAAAHTLFLTVNATSRVESAFAESAGSS
jgi:hypothetical protein